MQYLGKFSQLLCHSQRRLQPAQTRLLTGGEGGIKGEAGEGVADVSKGSGRVKEERLIYLMCFLHNKSPNIS